MAYATRKKQPCGRKFDLLTTGSGPQELGHIMMADQLSLITPKCVRESRFLGLSVILIGAGDDAERRKNNRKWLENISK